VAIDNGQKPERAAVEQRIRHEVHRPAVVHGGDLWPIGTIAPGPFALRRFYPDRQAFFAIQPVSAFVVQAIALAQQQDVETPIAVAHPAGRQILQPNAQLGLRITARLVAL
jgi:hypothetical protein